LCFGPFEHAPEGLADARQDGLGVAGQQSPDGGAQDDQELVGLKQHGQMAARYGVTSNDRKRDDDGADDDQHGARLGSVGPISAAL